MTQRLRLIAGFAQAAASHAKVGGGGKPFFKGGFPAVAVLLVQVVSCSIGDDTLGAQALEVLKRT